MKSSLYAFKKGLVDLQLYIRGLDLETKLPPLDKKTEELAVWERHYKILTEHYYENRALKKRYDYNSIIISLYGLVEQYLEVLMQDYLELLQQIVPSYSVLPQSIINNHVAVSFELIKQTEQSRYRGSNTKGMIISRLNSCLSDPQNYRLNAEAFCHHSANFRSNVIDEFFRQVGFLNIMQEIVGNKTFKNLLIELDLSELHDRFEKLADKKTKEDKASSLQERAFYFLNDLADRRNEVAHGISSQLLAHDILLTYVHFLEIFCETVYDVLFQNLLRKEIEFRGVSIGKPTAIYKDGYVACVWSNKAHIKKDDYIVGQNANEIVLGKVCDIQIENVEVDEVASKVSVEVGLRTDCKLRKTYHLSLISKDKNILV
jgi:hypothetical protein